MKIAGKTFPLEEFVFCVVLIGFFVWIMAGASSYSEEATLFPYMLSIPGLVLMVLYLFRGLLPERLERVITMSDQFAIGKSAATTHKPRKTDRGETAGDDGPTVRQLLQPYVIFVFTAGYGVLAWAVGFYAASIAAVLVYVALVRRDVRRAPVIATILLVFALATTAVFDSAFGHHYGRGAFLSFF
jgi:hypothetical protein